MSALYIGLMSGTSLDGVDAVLAEIDEPGCRALAHVHAELPARLRATLLALSEAEDDGVDAVHRTALALTGIYADTVRALLRKADVVAGRIAAIGCHGQTIRHRPELGYSVQLNAPARLAELTGICVIADFRSRDIAAGGKGAPLVPAFHAAQFSHASRSRVVLNIGGMSNVTLLDPGATTRGFDCGPGNVLMDGWIHARRGRPYDSNGDWARSGTANKALLARMLGHAFFRLDPPKSCGREEFNLRWLNELEVEALRAEDVQATLLELTARSVADAVDRTGFNGDEWLVCGGGAFNGYLLERLTRLVERPVLSTAEYGIPPDQVEALAFAWLAHQTLNGRPANLPAVTGARGARVIGAIWPA
ncbi:anhydro-N-acetylmuramic acid kinase [Methyloversatilis thermotolerans]|uniref:anhydro-N-acetylmuramic acid kinase n=1 Tax=Methyloversatilis thermotolerans TaxID=1346290 RepID=UPI000382DD1A|nr:anhydro-N-acetylmuramic acid kinase [Methyloversatilis thermotolerans]